MPDNYIFFCFLRGNACFQSSHVFINSRNNLTEKCMESFPAKLPHSSLSGTGDNDAWEYLPWYYIPVTCRKVSTCTGTASVLYYFDIKSKDSLMYKRKSGLCMQWSKLYRNRPQRFEEVQLQVVFSCWNEARSTFVFKTWEVILGATFSGHFIQKYPLMQSRDDMRQWDSVFPVFENALRVSGTYVPLVFLVNYWFHFDHYFAVVYINILQVFYISVSSI